MKLHQPVAILLLSITVISGVAEHTQQPAEHPFTFIQICDPQLGKGGYEHDLKAFEQAVVQSNILKPDFVVICGDLVSRLNEQSVKDINRIKAGFNMPVHCVPGNHDVFWGPQDKRNHISQPQSLANYRKAFGKDYYSFEHNGHVFLCANSMLWRTEVEIEEEIKRHHQWVKDTLAAASKRRQPVFVVMHHPLYVNEPDEKDSGVNLPLERRRELLALFEKYGVVAVLTGHAHRIIINDHKGIQMVTGEATSTTHGAKVGFRLWHIGAKRPYKHESVPLVGF